MRRLKKLWKSSRVSEKKILKTVLKVSFSLVKLGLLTAPQSYKRHLLLLNIVVNKFEPKKVNQIARSAVWNT